jgi:hypothetical protein
MQQQLCIEWHEHVLRPRQCRRLQPQRELHLVQVQPNVRLCQRLPVLRGYSGWQGGMPLWRQKSTTVTDSSNPLVSAYGGSREIGIFRHFFEPNAAFAPT